MLLVPNALPTVSRRRVLFGAAGLALLGAGVTACGSPPPPPEFDDLVAQLDRAHADSQLAEDAAAAARPDDVKALTAVASERAAHAEALADEIARITGEPTQTGTSEQTSPTTSQSVPAPTSDDVVAALRGSAESAAKLAAQVSGYRAGLLGSIAAACTAAYTVALAAPGGAR